MEEYQNVEQNSEDVKEIITSVPSWIVRWGITIIFLVLICIIVLSALVKYPDVIRTSLRINSTNAPKAMIAKQAGKLISILVDNGQWVKQGEPLAYFESTAQPADVLRLVAQLKKIRVKFCNIKDNTHYILPTDLTLGEIQADYQIFYQEYLQYQATQKDGYYLKQISFLERDLQNIRIIDRQILQHRRIQNQEYVNVKSDYEAYKRLFEKKVISSGEFRQKENQYLAAMYPLQQTQRDIIDNNTTAGAKERELSTLHNTIAEQKARYLQSLNQLLNACERWMQEYTLRASVSGRVSYAGIVQTNQNITASQEVFIINAGNTDFFGEVRIPQYNMGKVRLGQVTLIKLHSFPFEQYGMIRGKVVYISDVAYSDSIFIAKIRFDRCEGKTDSWQVKLKNGMLADAEIITEESSLMARLFRNLRKMGTN